MKRTPAAPGPGPGETIARSEPETAASRASADTAPPAGEAAPGEPAEIADGARAGSAAGEAAPQSGEPAGRPSAAEGAPHAGQPAAATKKTAAGVDSRAHAALRSAPGVPPTSDNTPPAPAVEFDHVYKAFVARGRGAEPVLALQDVTFDVQPGEFVSLVGPSGCGKSTCLNLLAGLTTPSDGTVNHHGEPVRKVNTNVGYITQDDNLLPWRSLRGNVELSLELQGVPRRERHDRAQEYINLVGLQGFEDHYPHELSGGMRKRAGIIRTLVYDSSVVLMDEPFGPLDAQTRVILQAELLTLWARTRPTVLFVTHDLVEAIALSDRILVFTSNPGTIKRDYPVTLPRPRDPFRIHETPGFSELHDALWADIRVEIENR